MTKIWEITFKQVNDIYIAADDIDDAFKTAKEWVQEQIEICEKEKDYMEHSTKYNYRITGVSFHLETEYDYDCNNEDNEEDEDESNEEDIDEDEEDLIKKC